MFSSFFFLQQTSKYLQIKLSCARLCDAYKQTDESIVLEFELSSGHFFYIELLFSPTQCLFHFPKSFHKSKKAVSVLKELVGLQVNSVQQVFGERTFIIHFQNHYAIVFKWFGRNSNLLLWLNGEVKWVLQSHLKKDFEYHEVLLPLKPAFTEEYFHQLEGDVFHFIPQLKKDIVQTWKLQVQYDILSIEEQWKYVQRLLSYLAHPYFYVIANQNAVRLSFWNGLHEQEKILDESHEIEEIIEKYFHAFLAIERVAYIKESFVKTTQTSISYATKKKEELDQILQHLEQQISPKELADVIMANLHAFTGYSPKAVLHNFYKNESIEVEIKAGYTPASYAALLYKKAKNRHLQVQKLEEQRAGLILKIAELHQRLLNWNEASSKEILTTAHSNKKAEVKSLKESQNTTDFKEYECMGFKILVGRNAKNNDELTIQFASKNDLWLHAKDVSGSHVVVKHQVKDQIFPKPVIERAAQLAAFYSKRKNDSLCPVMYTLVKYVRKPKGAAAGAVRVEREKVLLVAPVA